MELERRQRQRRTDRKEAVGADGGRSIHDVPDDLLQRFFLRLDSPIWLIRAACACKRWRRVFTDDGDDEGRAFLRIAGSLHLPAVVGQYHNLANGDHRFVPSSSTTPAPPPIDVSRFAVDDGLLTKNSRWHVADCHGGLILLRMRFGQCAPSVPNFIVYDPLTRRHKKVYRPPPPNKQVYGEGIRDAFLLDGDDDNISLSNFRVFCRWFNNVGVYAADPQVCVFSTANGGDWRFLSHQSGGKGLFRRFSGNVAGRVDGSLYLGLFMGVIIVLDNTTLAFSKVNLPIGLDLNTLEGLSTFTVVHAVGLGPTLPPRTSIVHVRGEELELFRRVHGSGEWVLEHTIANLSKATRVLSVCLEECTKMEWRTVVDVVADGTSFAVLSVYSHSGNYDKIWFFSIDVNTMELRVLPEELYRRDTRSIINYTLPWPQFLRACP